MLSNHNFLAKALKNRHPVYNINRTEYPMGFINAIAVLFAGLGLGWFGKSRRDIRGQTGRPGIESQSKLQELEQELAARNAELAEARQQLESFVYSASHDLRAPLRAIKGFTLALREDYGQLFNEQGKDYAQRIVDGADRMEQMLAALLTYSRVGRGDIPLVNIDLEEFLPKLGEQWAAEVQAHGAQLEIARPLPSVTGHPLLLEQALTQLVANALKFVPPGSAPYVSLQTQESNGAIRIKVADQGIGIDPKHHPRLFGVFQRFNNTDKYPGLGIGLAIVRKAAERMNGKAGLEPQSSQGSCFWIELPKARSGVTSSHPPAGR